jgi:hypothetical protein
MRVIEEILIRRALRKTKGNCTRAAEVLEISHRVLLYEIKDYRISDLQRLVHEADIFAAMDARASLTLAGHPHGEQWVAARARERC